MTMMSASDWLKSADVIRANDPRLTTREIGVSTPKQSTAQSCLTDSNSKQLHSCRNSSAQIKSFCVIKVQLIAKTNAGRCYEALQIKSVFSGSMRYIIHVCHAV